MFSNEVCRKLENIINGTVIKEQPDTCTTIRNKLCSSFSTSSTVKQDFEGKSVIKKEQERFLQELATARNYWVKDLPDPRNGSPGKSTLNAVLPLAARNLYLLYFELINRYTG